MLIPIFAMVDVAELVALLPPVFWDTLDERFRPTWDLQGRATVSWRLGCTEIERALRLIREFGVLTCVRFREHEESDVVWLRLQLKDSSVEPSPIKEYVGWAALVQLMGLSPILRPVAFILGLTSLFGAAAVVQTVPQPPTTSRVEAKSIPEPPPPPPTPNEVKIKSKPAQAWSVGNMLIQVGVAITFSWVLAWNARNDLGCGKIDRPPSEMCDFLSAFTALDAVLLPARLEQEWKMFCDPAKRVAGRYLMIGTLRDGSQFDVWHGIKIGPDNNESTRALKEYGWRHHNEGSWRSLKFYELLHTGQGVPFRDPLCRWTCRLHNNERSSGYWRPYPERPHDLHRYTLSFEEVVRINGTEQVKNVTLSEWACF